VIALPPCLKITECQKQRLVEILGSCTIQEDAVTGACICMYGRVTGVPAQMTSRRWFREMVRGVEGTLGIVTATADHGSRRSMEKIYLSLVGQKPI
jgi:hypothetical protein